MLLTDWNVHLRACRRCKVARPHVFFRRKKGDDTNFHSWCSPCRVEANRIKRAAQVARDPEGYAARRRELERKRTYGVTTEDFIRMVEQQQGGCAICGEPQSTVRLGKLKPLAIDHCHTTGKVRGLLCDKHNMGLGLFADNPQLLRAAADYLEATS